MQDAFDGAPYTLAWHKDGEPIPNATTTSYAKQDVGLADAGSYTLVVSNPWGEVVSAPADVQVLEAAGSSSSDSSTGETGSGETSSAETSSAETMSTGIESSSSSSSSMGESGDIPTSSGEPSADTGTGATSQGTTSDTSAVATTETGSETGETGETGCGGCQTRRETAPLSVCVVAALALHRRRRDGTR